MFSLKFTRNFRLDRDQAWQDVTFLMSNFGSRGLQYLKKYPPQRNPRSEYVRGFGYPPIRTSEDLGPRWNKSVKRTKKGVLLTIGNNASYAQYVQSRQLQAGIHRNWWQTEEDMIELLFPDLLDEFARFLPVFIVKGR